MKSRITRVAILSFGIAIALFLVVFIFLAVRQDAIVQQLVRVANQQIEGEIKIAGSHISFFETFPRLTIDLEGLELFEVRNDSLERILLLEDTYISFHAPSLLSGKIKLNTLTLTGGAFHLIQHADSTLNLQNALTVTSETNPQIQEETDGSVIDFGVKKIKITNLDISKTSETNGLLVDSFVNELQATIDYTPDHLLLSLDGKSVLNIIQNGDTTFFHNKRIEVSSTIDYDQKGQVLTLAPSTIKLDNGEFRLEGYMSFVDDGWLEFSLNSTKKNLDLIAAFLPPEVAPAIQRYDNGGEIYLHANARGKILHGKYPSLTAAFGFKEVYIYNKTSNKSIQDLQVKGIFSAENLGDLSTMKLIMKDFTARPEAGNFSGILEVENFESPEIEMQLNSEFDLDFLADFLELRDLQNLSGKVSISMNFHDIIDLDQPEKSLERLNESYYTEFQITNLSFASPDFHLPIKNLNLAAIVEGNEARIDGLSLQAGSSDVQLTASISDLPSIIHHTNTPVEVSMKLKSSILNLKELTSTDSLKKPINEQIKDLNMNLSFKSSARALTESPYLPLGEFFIEELYAKLENYPHTLHDFHADIIIDSTDFNVLDFSGVLDESDFHFDGTLSNYDLWFIENPIGDTRIDFNLSSALIRLEDLFTYDGQNYVPEDYRYEEITNMNLDGYIEMHFDSLLVSADLHMLDANATMKVHPMRFRDFGGQVHLENNVLQVTGARGKLGDSDFVIDYMDKLDSKDDTAQLMLVCKQLNFDQLFNYNPPPVQEGATSVDHKAGFNIFEVPFQNLSVQAKVDRLNYHRYLLEDLELALRMQPDHYIYMDTFGVKAASGKLFGNGYFNGSNPDEIYLQPNFIIEGMMLEKLLFKFENFGQDYLVSDNIAGKLNANINGKIHVYPDLVPILDDSEINMKIEVLNGQLKQYALLDVLADYFKDRNLNQVRFDTLQNELSFSRGILEIPRMNLNTTLGFYEIKGRQSLTDYSMDYVVGVPLKTVTGAVRQKLFGNREQVSADQVDEIVYRDESEKIKMVYVRVKGKPDNYSIDLGDK